MINQDSNAQCSVIVMAGGQSKRMGMDKGQLATENGTFAESVIHTALKISPHVYISVGIHNQHFYQNENVELICDIENQKGPLGGIVSVLPKINTTWFQFLTVDAPFFMEDNFFQLWNAKENYDGVVFSTEGKLHPLLGLYKTSTKSLWMQAFQKEELKLMNILKSLNLKVIESDNSANRAFLNINTQMDYLNSIE